MQEHNMSDEPSNEQQPADEPKGQPDPPSEDKKFSQKDIDRIIAGRMSKYADYDDLKSKAGQFEQLENEKKTETQKLTEDRDGHKSRAEKAEADLMRLTVGIDKGLTPAQARRLVGSTKEELEADADDLLASFGGGGGSPSSKKPTERLRGGGEPDDDPEVDLTKVIADIPR